MSTPKIRLQLARKLRDLRKKSRLTQEEAAGLAGMDARHYQKFESFKKPQSPRLETIEKLAKAFKTTPSKLLDF